MQVHRVIHDALQVALVVPHVQGQRVDHRISLGKKTVTVTNYSISIGEGL
jgi:hypothetical protein